MQVGKVMRGGHTGRYGRADKGAFLEPEIGQQCQKSQECQGNTEFFGLDRMLRKHRESRRRNVPANTLSHLLTFQYQYQMTALKLLDYLL